MKKIKILHIAQSSNAMSVYFGNENIFFPLIFGLAEKNEYEITLVIPGYNAALKKKSIENMTLHFMNFRKKSFLKSLLVLKKIINDNKFDIIHTHDTLSNFIIYLLCVISRKKIAPVICSSRNKVLFSKYMEYKKKIKQDFVSLLEKKLMNSNDFNICAGKNIKSDYLFLEIMPSKLNLIEPRIENTNEEINFENVKKIRSKVIGAYSSNIKIAAIFGEFDRLKYGFDVFVKTVKYFKQTYPDIQVKFAAYGVTEENKLTDYFRLQNITEDIIIVDNTYTPDEVINSIDIIVLPYRYSEYPLSLLKSLKAGKPAICSDTNSFADIIKEGANGFLSPIADYVYISEKIAILCDYSIYEKISAQAAVTDLNKDFDIMISKYCELDRKSVV